jgi:hypothetical protein
VVPGRFVDLATAGTGAVPYVLLAPLTSDVGSAQSVLAAAAALTPLVSKTNAQKGTVLSATAAVAVDPAAGWDTSPGSARVVVVLTDTDYWCGNGCPYCCLSFACCV